jgi:UDP-2-acetamido-3-amino-2,3-dideoxy-glucuronate N-acetyltransferase
MDISVAVIGAGHWGKNLVRNFHSLGALDVICDANEEALKTFAEQYPGVETSVALSHVLRRPSVDAVVIATPAETHASIAREALLAGKHVFVEKPLALDVAEARDLTRLARDKGLVLMVGHLLQYHPAFLKTLAMARSGELGRIDYVYSNRLNLGMIRRQENSLWSFAPHDVSMVLSLIQEEPEEVLCQGGCYLHSKIADVTVSMLRFPSGAQAHFFVSWLHPFKEQKLVVVGDRGMLVFDDGQPWESKLVLYPHAIRWEGAVPVPDKAEGQNIAVEPEEPLRQECLHFLECIRDGAVPRTDGHEGVRVLRVLKASQRSMDTRQPVSLEVFDRSCADDDCFVHPSAVVDAGVQVGKGSSIWHFSHLLPGTELGRNCKVGQNVVIGPDVSVGHGCKIQNNVSVYKGVTLEDDVFCGPSMVFTNVHNPRSHTPRMDQVRETLVRTGATLGANCTVVCGVTIGRNAFVGAGAVVTRSVPDHALVLGNPARVSGWVCRCAERLDDELCCPVCGIRHTRGENGLVPQEESNINE